MFELDPTGSRAKKSTSGASKELGFRLRRANSHTHDARAAHQTANGDLETLGPWRYTRPKDTEPLTLVRGWCVLYCYTTGVVLESRRAQRPASASVGNSYHSLRAKPPPDNHPRPHLTSESWSSLKDWAARASPLTARRVVLAPPSCGPSFPGSSTRAACRI